MTIRAGKIAFLFLLLLSATTVASCRAGSNDLPAIKKDNPHLGKDVKVLVAYQSKYGSTKQYAEWIQQETGGDLVNVGAGDKPDLARYDIMIIGGYVRAGNIVVAPFVKDHWSVMKPKEVILFTTSSTPPGHPKIQHIYEKSLPEEIRKEMKYFPLHGRISEKDLTFGDKFLIAIGKIMERDEALKRDMGKDFDGVRRENLLPLLDYVEAVQMFRSGKKSDR